VQPDYFATIAKRLSESGLLREENGRWRRVIIEKPFGHDLDSARKLNSQLTSVLQEHQIYRIDHYLRVFQVCTRITASFDGTARVWEAATGKPISEPLRHEGWVTSAQFSLDGQRVLTVSRGVHSAAQFWDIPAANSKDMSIEALLLAALAEANGGVTSDFRTGREFHCPYSRASQRNLGENKSRAFRSLIEVNSIATISAVEHLVLEKPNRLPIFQSQHY
jgi:WD40 repeat protein